jgi:hypothetical protein
LNYSAFALGEAGQLVPTMDRKEKALSLLDLTVGSLKGKPAEVSKVEIWDELMRELYAKAYPYSYINCIECSCEGDIDDTE